MMKTLQTAILLVSLLLVGCTTDSYDTGEGAYSNTVADFAEMRSDGAKHGVSFVTDEGVNYILENTISASWIKTADSVYRACVYYNKVSETMAHAVSCFNIPTLRPKAASNFIRQPQDPLDVESCWMSKNGKYLNMALLIKNGRNESGYESVHALSLVLDETHQNADGTKTAYYRLLHDKRTAPAYYTNRHYVSVLLPNSNRPDSVRLTIKTYSADYVKTLKL